MVICLPAISVILVSEGSRELVYFKADDIFYFSKFKLATTLSNAVSWFLA